MDKPMSEYAADAPRLLRDFLTYISTIQGKSAKTAHEYYLDLRLFFRVLKHNKGLVPRDMPIDHIPIDDIDLAFLRDVTLSDAYDYLEYMSGERQPGAGIVVAKAVGREPAVDMAGFPSSWCTVPLRGVLRRGTTGPHW